MPTKFRQAFDQLDDPTRERAKYLSRLFGIFSEKIVAIWARDERSPYENLGRPTLRLPEAERGHTLDFTFRDRATSRVYVVEMKCEIEYLNFKYFILDASHQLDHHTKPAFDAFLKAARHPHDFVVRVRQKEVKIEGGILVWGAIGRGAKNMLVSERGFHNVLSIEDISSDLATWRNADYLEMIERYRTWSNRLFDALISRSCHPDEFSPRPVGESARFD